MGKTKIKQVDYSKQEETKALKQEAQTEEKSQPIKKQAKKTASLHHRSRKYQEAAKLINQEQNYPINEAVELSQQASYSKFPGTIEVHINTTAANLRGLVSLPFISGKALRILAFGKEADESGADQIGSEETISQIEKGKIDFDILITTPEWMPKLARLARILGPKGLMPNPKNGTITDNLRKTVAELKKGKTEYKTEAKGQVIHLAVGKVGQPKEEIASNVKVLYNALGRSKVSKITLSPTMGPGVKVEISSLLH